MGHGLGIEPPRPATALERQDHDSRLVRTDGDHEAAPPAHREFLRVAGEFLPARCSASRAAAATGGRAGATPRAPSPTWARARPTPAPDPSSPRTLPAHDTRTRGERGSRRA